MKQTTLLAISTLLTAVTADVVWFNNYGVLYNEYSVPASAVSSVRSEISSFQASFFSSLTSNSLWSVYTSNLPSAYASDLDVLLNPATGRPAQIAAFTSLTASSWDTSSFTSPTASISSFLFSADKAAVCTIQSFVTNAGGTIPFATDCPSDSNSAAPGRAAFVGIDDRWGLGILASLAATVAALAIGL